MAFLTSLLELPTPIPPEVVPTKPTAPTPEAPPPPPPETDEGLQQLAFLVGGVWVAEAVVDGVSYRTAERCYWALEGSFVFTEVHQGSGSDLRLAARGVFGWDGQAAALRSWSFTVQAAFNDSVQIGGGSQPPSWVFRTVTGGSAGSELRVRLAHPSADVLAVTQEQPQADGRDRLVRTLRYQRQGV